MTKNAFGPYSPVYRADNLYFISGQLGIVPDTKKAAPDIKAQAHQAMKNLEDVLASKNLDMNSLVKTTIYLTDMNDFGIVNEIYVSYFEKSKPKPARTCAEVSGLPKLANHPLLIEIEAVAYKRQR